MDQKTTRTSGSTEERLLWWMQEATRQFKVRSVTTVLLCFSGILNMILVLCLFLKQDVIAIESVIESIAPRYDKDGEAIEGRYVINLTKEVPNKNGILQVSLRDGRKIKLSVEAMLVLPYKQGTNNQTQIPGLSWEPTKQLYIHSMDASDILPGSKAFFVFPDA